MAGNVPPIADERAGLLGFLAQQRYLLTLTAYGLTDEQARLAPTNSSLTVGGLIKHVTATERNWIRLVLGQEQIGPERYAETFAMGPEQTLAELVADLEAAGSETEAVVADVADLGQDVPVPDAPWFADQKEPWSVRWVLFHLIEEVARHVGHADLVREHVDGATAYPLMAAAENWPDSPWLQKWQPTQPV